MGLLCFDWKNIETWPPRWPKNVQSLTDPKLDNLSSDFRNNYNFIRAFHATRCEDVNTYYTAGIQIADFDYLLEKAKKIFCADPFDFTAQQVECAASRIGRFEKRLFLGLDDRLLLEQCGHYLIYGSEFLGSIGAQLTSLGKGNPKALLKAIGKPTMFICNVPINAIDNKTLNELAYYILSRRPTDFMDFTLTLRQPLLGKNILGHYFPTNIPDPLNNFTKYSAETK